MGSKTQRMALNTTVEFREASYVLLAVFNIFLAFMTHQRGGGFEDWKAVVVIVVLVLLSGLLLWLGLNETIRRLT